MPTPTVTISNATSIADFTNGLNAIQGQGTLWQLAFGGTWAAGDTYSCELVSPSQTYDFGIGRMTGLVPVSALTLNKRVHFVAGTYWCGSDNDNATAWEQQAPGAFKIPVANQFSQNENLLSLSSFQGRMAVASRNTITVWELNADPTQISIVQTIGNMGTVGPFGMQSLGDFDILFPSDSGIRSLRVLTINLNGFITDIGSPIDTLTQAAILGQSTTQLSGICAVVDPQSKRYMIYFPSNGTIYVLNYYPTAKITAWSTFTPTIGANGLISFKITTFKIFGSVIYFRGVCTNGTVLPNGATEFVGCYGTPDGSAGYMYDNVQATVSLPWYDLKNPGRRKTAKGVDVVIQGQWSVYGSMDFNGVNTGGALTKIADKLNATKTGAPSTSVYSSAQTGMVTWTDSGYHAIVKVVNDDLAYPGLLTKFSELVYYYEGGDEKP